MLEFNIGDLVLDSENNRVCTLLRVFFDSGKEYVELNYRHKFYIQESYKIEKYKGGNFDDS